MSSGPIQRDYEKLLPLLLNKMFPEKAAREEVVAIFYSYHHLEQHRVQVGILKASQGDIPEIKRLSEIGECDWRDLLCIVEYPLTSPKWGLMDKNPEKYEKLRVKEQRQYEEWIISVLGDL